MDIYFCNDDKVIFKKKKQFAKDGSFTNFWFMGSKNWFINHKSRTLNSNPARMFFFFSDFGIAPSSDTSP